MSIKLQNEIADVMLATQEGYTAIHKEDGRLWAHDPTGKKCLLPRPTQDWNLCGPLISKYMLIPNGTYLTIACVATNTGKLVTVDKLDFLSGMDGDKAMRHAIVLAAWTHLTGQSFDKMTEEDYDRLVGMHIGMQT